LSQRWGRPVEGPFTSNEDWNHDPSGYFQSLPICLQARKKVGLKDHDTGWAQTKELKELGKDVVKDRAKEILDKNLVDLADAQELLYADDRYAVLIVLQAKEERYASQIQ
jgi:hypothetical protein